MKKYLKSGNQPMEQDMNIAAGPVQNVEIYPPLPPYPPPELQIKQEIIDEGYENQAPSGTEQNAQEIAAKADVAEKGEIMCKNFFRGACNRGANCIYVHKVILSQLGDVYRFCNDYQNSKCTRPKCRFVHATVFEKEHFLRTGELPAHAFDHITDPNNPVQPPPAVEVTPPVLNTEVPKQFNFTMPAIPAVSTVSTNVPTAAPPAQVAAPMVFTGAAATPGPSYATNWTGYESYTNPPLNYAASATTTPTTRNRCSECDINEFRLQYNKNKLENLNKANEELDVKIAKINNKARRMQLVMEAIIKPLALGQTSSLLNVNPEAQAMSNLQARLALHKMRRGLH